MNEYMLYKGETIIARGTAKECAATLNIQVKTLMFYGTPTYASRNKNGRRLVKLGKSTDFDPQ